MIRIVVDDEQASAIAGSHDPVEVCDGRGKVLGFIKPSISADEKVQIAEIKRRLSRSQPRYTTAEVLERLEKMSEK